MRELPLIDKLILQGWKFDPSTVVIEASELLAEPGGSRSSRLLDTDFFSDNRCMPPFKQIIIQYHHDGDFPPSPKYGFPDGFKRLNFMYHVQFHEGANHSRLIVVHYSYAEGQMPAIFPWGFTLEFLDDGYLIANPRKVWESPIYELLHQYPGFNAPEHMRKQQDLEKYRDIESFQDMAEDILRVFHYMLQKRDVEFIDFPKPQIRRARRLLGKEPSPYFMLKVTNKPIKQYGNGEVSHLPSGNKRDLPIHIVRGHFMTHPDDHPIPQFAGKTFWVTDHVRGDKAHGEIKKGYTIRL